MSLGELVSALRARAEQLARFSPAAAEAFLEAADEIETALRGWLDEPLGLDAAQMESGYSSAHLRRLIREGRIPNAGSAGEPLILRRHLPRKPGAGVRPDLRVESRRQAARAVATGE